MRAGYVLTPGQLVLPGEHPRPVCVVVHVHRCEHGHMCTRTCGVFDTPAEAITAREWFVEFGHPLPERDGVQ